MISPFRASSRMFYPIYYLIFLGVLIYILKHYSNRNAKITIIILLVIQTVDLSSALINKNIYFNAGRIVRNSEFETNEWRYIVQNYKIINYLGAVRDADLAVFVAKNNIKSNVIPSTKGKYTEIQENLNSEINDIINGKSLPTDTVYVTKDRDCYEELAKNLNNNAIACDLGDYKVLIPKIEGMPLNTDKNIDLNINTIRAANFSDQNWTDGISNSSKTILFCNTQFKQELLKDAVALKVKNTTVRIKSVSVIDNNWIHVILEDDSNIITDFSYPNIIEVIK